MKLSSLSLLPTSKRGLNLVSVRCQNVPMQFLLDTGAYRSRIHIDSLKNLDGIIDLENPTISSLMIGTHEWNDVHCTVDHKENKSISHFGIHADGVLGTDILNGKCWIFHRPEKVLHIYDPGHPDFLSWTQAADHFIPLRTHLLAGSSNHVWACTGSLNGHGPIHINIDTGAQRTILTTKAGAYLDPNAKRQPIKLSNGGDISQAPSYRTNAEEIRLGNLVFPNPTVAVCDPIFSVAPELLGKPAILLGIDVFGELPYALDLQNGGMWFSS